MTQLGRARVGTLNGAGEVSGVTVDDANDTVYTADYMKNTMSAWDGRSWNASDLAGVHCKPRHCGRGSPHAIRNRLLSHVDVPLHTVYVVN